VSTFGTDGVCVCSSTAPWPARRWPSSRGVLEPLMACLAHVVLYCILGRAKVQPGRRPKHFAASCVLDRIVSATCDWRPGPIPYHESTFFFWKSFSSQLDARQNEFQYATPISPFFDPVRSLIFCITQSRVHVNPVHPANVCLFSRKYFHYTFPYIYLKYHVSYISSLLVTTEYHDLLSHSRTDSIQTIHTFSFINNYWTTPSLSSSLLLPPTPARPGLSSTHRLHYRNTNFTSFCTRMPMLVVFYFYINGLALAVGFT
jgi:hypothetical protein